MHMAPHGEGMGNIGSSGSCTTQQRSMISNVHRTTSDISFQISKEAALIRSSVNIEEDDDEKQNNTNQKPKLVTISEVELVVVAKCECCGMSEECTPEYIERVKSKFMGKWVCGLCAEAVKEEKEIKEKLENDKEAAPAAVSMEEALNIHMKACSRFNKLGRAYPVLFQAEAMREMLKKTASASGSSSSGRAAALRAAKSFSPRGGGGGGPVPNIARSSSCIPAITNINPSATSN